MIFTAARTWLLTSWIGLLKREIQNDKKEKSKIIIQKLF